MNVEKQEKMNLYEAIFTRKTIKRFTTEALTATELRDIQEHYDGLPGLFGNIHTEMQILKDGDKMIRSGPFQGTRVPYYLVFYSEEVPRCQMNAGYLMQHMVLYLCTIGLGSCYLSTSVLRRGQRQLESGKSLVGIVGFGYSKETHLRKRGDARRLGIEELCVFKEIPRQWVRQLLEAARLAPSVGNAQPWRFVVYDNRIHIFTKKHQVERFAHYTLEEQNFGGMLANIMIAAEELWVDVDLIRLENISQKSFPNNQYVLSAIMRN